MWTILPVVPTLDEEDNGMGMTNEGVSGSLHLGPQFGRDSMGRTILEDGVQIMLFIMNR